MRKATGFADRVLEEAVLGIVNQRNARSTQAMQSTLETAFDR
jgi:hypothetical protein